MPIGCSLNARKPVQETKLCSLKRQDELSLTELVCAKS